MTELKQQIKQARELVDLAEKRESVGGKLEPLVQDLFLHSSEIGGENLESFRGLCFKIAEMRKGTSLGCKFYKLLEESQLPFALDVLRFGVDAESYYNCNDAALKSYVLASLRKSQIPQEVIMPLDLGLPEGHIMSSYTKYLRSLGDSKPQPSPEISAELKQTLLFAASRRRFEQTRYKSFCAITYLDVQEGISFLNNEVVALPFLNDETKAILSDFQSGLNLLLETCKNYDKIMRRWMKEYATESWAEFSLRDLVLDELRTNFPGQASQINLELALSPGLTMRGHKENIGLLFANLLGNGLKATMAYDSPKIYVQAEQIEEGFKVILGNSCELPPQSVIDDLNSDAETERGGKIVIRRVVSDHGGSINYVPNGENNLEAILNFPEKTLVKF